MSSIFHTKINTSKPQSQGHLRESARFELRYAQLFNSGLLTPHLIAKYSIDHNKEICKIFAKSTFDSIHNSSMTPRLHTYKTVSKQHFKWLPLRDKANAAKHMVDLGEGHRGIY